MGSTLPTRCSVFVLALVTNLPAASFVIGAEAGVHQVLRLSAAQVANAGVEVTRAIAAAGSPPDAAGADGGSVQLSGRVTGPADSAGTLAAAADGRVLRYRVEPGRNVAAGAPLLDFESAGLMTLQRDFLAARAAAERASRALARDRLLAAEGLIATARLEASIEAELEVQATFAEHRGALLLAGWSDATLERLRTPADLQRQVTLHSPAAGRLMALGPAAGERATAGEVLARIGRSADLRLELSATVAQVASFRAGDAIRVVGCSQLGQVTAVSEVLDPRTQTQRVFGRIANAAGCLSAGQYFRAAIVRSAPAGVTVVRVPASALVQRQRQHYVFRAVDGGFEPTAVDVVTQQDGEAWLGSGLRHGDTVAHTGVSALKGLWLGLGTGEP
ncbi:MAG: hypothetical protein RL026_1163 [Pseudomonadota bacterium]